MKTKLDKRIYSLVLIAFLFGAIISITSSYAIAETLIKSVDVSYVDNAKLGATNVQAAIDGTCTKFSNDLQSFLLKVYPVGSIYISYDSTNPGTLFGGTWEVFGKGQTLVGIDSSQTEFSTVGKTGGAKNISTTLSIANLPSHSHIIPTLSGTAESSGDHTHTLGGRLIAWGANAGNVHFDAKDSKLVEAIPGTYGSGNPLVTSDKPNDPNYGATKSAGAHTHEVSTIASATTTCTNCNGTAFSTSTLQPYITVYMWRRTK